MKFSDILGQDDIKRHLKSAISMKNPAQSYIIEGERGMGKKLIADTFALGLMCDENGSEPCGKCHSCRMILSNNHPDIIHVIHDKPNYYSVEEIRTQVVDDCMLKPYYGKYKIYIIDEAEKIKSEGQNALLKTLEDPPDYVIIILLVSNIKTLLSTIQSRCVKLSTVLLKDDVISNYLVDELSIPKDRAEAVCTFARGNLGRAIELADSEDFEKNRSNIVTFISHIRDKSMDELIEGAKKLAETNRVNLAGLLDFFVIWYRDVLVYKTLGNRQMLCYKEEAYSVAQEAARMSYESIKYNLNMIEHARGQIASMVRDENAIVQMVLSFKYK